MTRASLRTELSFIPLPLGYREHHHGRTGRPVFRVTTAQRNSPWTSHSSVWPTSATVVSEKQRASCSSILVLQSSPTFATAVNNQYMDEGQEMPKELMATMQLNRIELEPKGKGCCVQMFARLGQNCYQIAILSVSTWGHLTWTREEDLSQKTSGCSLLNDFTLTGDITWDSPESSVQWLQCACVI